jgi:DNA-directed RNA polymerase alpha subunit
MAKIKTLKYCPMGHVFSKSSDCLVCPICEKTKPNDSLFLSFFSGPARRALENHGIKSLEDLSQFTEKDIIRFHGLGPKSITMIKKLMLENNTSFKKTQNELKRKR